MISQRPDLHPCVRNQPGRTDPQVARSTSFRPVRESRIRQTSFASSHRPRRVTPALTRHPPKMDSEVGLQRRDPKMDSEDGLQRRDPKTDSEDGLRRRDPMMDSEDGTRRRTPKMDYEDGLRGWTLKTDPEGGLQRRTPKIRGGPERQTTKKTNSVRRLSSSALMQATRAEAVKRLAFKRRVVIRPGRCKTPVPIRSPKSEVADPGPNRPASRSDGSPPSGESSLV